jgi:PAS domain S-box-containing protein
MLFMRRSSRWAYLIAVLGTALVVVTRLTVRPNPGNLLTSLEFILAVFAAGLFGGWKPGMTMTVLSLVTFDYFFIKPSHSLLAHNPIDLVPLIPYFVVGVGISVLCEGLHSAWTRMEERQRLLEREIEERRKAERSEQEQAERLRVTLASIGDAVITTDSQGRVSYLNAVAESLTGWTIASARGRDLESIFQIVNEKTRAVVENPIKKVLRDGVIVGLANHTILISRDGVERPIDDSAAPIRDKGGAISGAVMIFRDVSERRQAVNRLRLLWESASILLTTDEPDTMVHALFEKISRDLGVDAYFHFLLNDTGDALRVKSFAGLTEEEGQALHRVPLGQAISGNAALERQTIVATHIQDSDDTRAGWVKTHGFRAYVCSPLLSGDKVVGTLSFGSRSKDAFEPAEIDFLQTVTQYVTIAYERLRLVDQLREADRRKDEFLATLAHELRNPLAPLSNALQLWPFVEKDAAEMDNLRAMMERQVRQMTRLIDDLLDVSRISRGKIQLRQMPMDLSLALSDTIESLRPLMEARGQELTVSLPREPLSIQGDLTRLSQIFGNVLHNAAKYTEANGRISVVAERTGPNAVVRIRDSGCGIPSHMLSQIFEMFRQVDQSLGRAHGGLGIGLTLVKRLVELHGGTIEAQSAGPEKGSEFVITLPLEVADAQRDDRSTLKPASHPAGDLPRHQILVVDDLHASAQTLAMMLRAIGQEVALAHDGQAAVDWAIRNKPDVVFLDIAMPGMNGYEAARRIREIIGPDRPLLVALTGYGQDEDRRQAIEAGFNHHLTKPASLDSLCEVLLNRVPQRTARATN